MLVFSYVLIIACGLFLAYYITRLRFDNIIKDKKIKFLLEEIDKRNEIINKIIAQSKETELKAKKVLSLLEGITDLDSPNNVMRSVQPIENSISFEVKER